MTRSFAVLLTCALGVATAANAADSKAKKTEEQQIQALQQQLQAVEAQLKELDVVKKVQAALESNTPIASLELTDEEIAKIEANYRGAFPSQ